MTIADPSRYTVQFLPDGRLLARLDCNHGRGGYTAAEGVLALTPLAVTTRDRARQTPRTRGFRRSWSARRRMRSTPMGCSSCMATTGSLHLRPTLTGVRWAWQTFQGGDGTIVRPDDPSQYTVEFLPDGTLAIQADCHHATGTYTVDHSTSTCGSAEPPDGVPARIAHGSLPARSRPGHLPCLPRRQALLWPCRWTPASSPSRPFPSPLRQRRPPRDDRSAGSLPATGQAARCQAGGERGADRAAHPSLVLASAPIDAHERPKLDAISCGIKRDCGQTDEWVHHPRRGIQPGNGPEASLLIQPLDRDVA